MKPSTLNIDINELLAERRQIAHVWGTDDVLGLRPDLDEDRAWRVLQEVERHLDSEHGITWDTIRDAADDLYPAPSHGGKGARS